VHRESQQHDAKLLSVSSPDIERFSTFFHCQTRQTIGNFEFVMLICTDVTNLPTNQAKQQKTGESTNIAVLTTHIRLNATYANMGLSFFQIFVMSSKRQ